MDADPTTPADAALVIIERLDVQLARTMPAAFPISPTKIFQQFCGAVDVAADAKVVELALRCSPEFSSLKGGVAELIIQTVRVCAHCAGATRLRGGPAWVAVLKAERHAGVALAIIVANAGEKHRRALVSKIAKEAQVQANETLQKHVLVEASKSAMTSVSSAACRIVDELARDYEDLAAAMQHFGANLNAEGDPIESRERLKKTFGTYIYDAIRDSGALAGDRRVSAKAFERWKNSFRLPG